MSAPWWAAFPAAEAVVGCGTLEHTLSWSQGRLVAVDHPDLEAERVLVALGGAKPQCLATVEAWHAHEDDLDVLVLGPRSPGESLAADTKDDDDDWLQSLLPGGSGRFRPTGPPQPPPGGPGGSGARRIADGGRIRRDELLELFALGPAFQQRLSAAVAWAWSADGPHATDWAAQTPRLVAALAGRLAPVAGRWLGLESDQVRAEPWTGPGWGRVRVDDTGPELVVSASLPIGWLARVWASGLAGVDGHLVIDVLSASLPRARVLALSRPDAEPVTLAVERRGDRWARADD